MEEVKERAVGKKVSFNDWMGSSDEEKVSNKKGSPDFN